MKKYLLVLMICIINLSSFAGNATAGTCAVNPNSKKFKKNLNKVSVIKSNFDNYFIENLK